MDGLNEKNKWANEFNHWNSGLQIKRKTKLIYYLNLLISVNRWSNFNVQHVAVIGMTFNVFILFLREVDLTHRNAHISHFLFVQMTVFKINSILLSTVQVYWLTFFYGVVTLSKFNSSSFHLVTILIDVNELISMREIRLFQIIFFNFAIFDASIVLCSHVPTGTFFNCQKWVGW